MKHQHNIHVDLGIQEGLLYSYRFWLYPKFADKRTGIEDKELGAKILKMYYGKLPHSWLQDTYTPWWGMAGLRIPLKEFDYDDHLKRALEMADDIQDFLDDIFDKMLMAKMAMSS